MRRRLAGRAGAARPEFYGEVRLSPDAARLAVRLPGMPGNLWVYDLATGNGAPLLEPGANGSPVWTPDGRRLIFHSFRNGKVSVYWRQMDGGAQPAELLLEAESPESPVFPESCSPDGQTLIVRVGTGNGDAYALSLDGSRKLTPLVLGRRGYFFQFSPDGKWISFVSGPQLWVHSYPPGEEQQITFDGGDEQHWSRTGDELFYRNRDSWMAVPIALQPRFKKLGEPREVFTRRFANIFGYSEDVSPDAQRFLMLIPEHEETPATELHVITNWSQELQRRVPAATPRR